MIIAPLYLFHDNANFLWLVNVEHEWLIESHEIQTTMTTIMINIYCLDDSRLAQFFSMINYSHNRSLYQIKVVQLVHANALFD